MTNMSHMLLSNVCPRFYMVSAGQKNIASSWDLDIINKFEFNYYEIARKWEE